jgi:voltage-gated potassium channel Kch
VKPEQTAGGSTLGRVRRAVADHIGLLIGVAALAALVLGVVGYRQWAPDRRFTEHLYRSIQLFIIFVDPSGSADPASPPVALEVARFLAPAAAAAASIRAVLALFGQRAARAWVRFFVRDHLVVAGLGPIGARLAVAFRDAGHRVVALEADESAAAVSDCRARGVVVLTGDPGDADLLFRSGVVKARYLVVASDDDGTNAGAALAARRVVDRRHRPLPCFVHVAHPGLANLLVEGALATGAGGPLRIEYFNAWESVPPMVLDEFPPGDHMLVVGPGRLGRSVVAHAARRQAGTGTRLQVTLVGRGAEEAGRDLAGRYPRLSHVCDLAVHDVDVESSEFERVTAAAPGLSGAYVAVEDDDAQALQAALTLSRVAPHVRIVVLTTRRSGLAALVSEIRPGASPIVLFDVLERSCRPEILLNGTIELLARAIHRNYVRAQAAAGRTAAESPSLREWDELPDATKEANRAQAADVGTKLAAVGCRIRPWTDWTGDGLAFAPEEIERMAEMEHERWCRERAADGWTYAPTRDDERKTTPYLVPWDDLADDVKDYDRHAVRAMPELLTHAGFEIVRLP